MALRLALMTTGLRPAARAFATLPGRPVGIIRWDGAEAIASRDGWREHPLSRFAIARLRGRPYASLAHLAASDALRYAEIAKQDATTLCETLARWRIDLVITSGCPMVPMACLASVRHGGINLHPSALPRYRGADPLLWQVADGVREIGVTVHRLTAGSDTGAIIASRSTARPPRASRAMLADTLEGTLGVPMLARAITDIERGITRATEQPETSPTRYARALRLNEIADVLPLAGLDMGRCRDLVHLLGECPPGWLELAGWRRRVPWKPGRFTDDAQGRAADDGHWRCVRGPFAMGLRRAGQTLWFEPVLQRFR